MTLEAAAISIRWLARVGAVASFVFVGAFVFGGSEDVGKWPSLMEWIGLVCFPIGVLTGFAVSFWREAAGGLISLASLAGFYLWHFATAKTPVAGPWFLIVTIPAALFLLAALLSKKSGEPRARVDADRAAGGESP